MKMKIFDRLFRKKREQYFETPRPTEDYWNCSDDDCPCSEVEIRRGSGYVYISQEVVDFRRDCCKLEDAERKIQRIRQEMHILGVTPSVSFRRSFNPDLICGQAARLRGLDLGVAAADAEYWWKTGKLPLRATPLAGKKPR